MGNSESRPRAGAAPPVTQGADFDLLAHLLSVELERLETAQQIERDRSIVFPETSIIVRDILRIQQAI